MVEDTPAQQSSTTSSTTTPRAGTVVTISSLLLLVLVVAGGSLVVQSVATWRGMGRRVGIDKRTRISQGTTALVEMGGSIHFIGLVDSK